MTPFSIDDLYRVPFHGPGTPEYAEATQTIGPSARPSPSWAMVARNLFDVVSGIDHARSSGLKLVVAADGRSTAGPDPVRKSVLIRTQFDSPVRIDAAAQVAHVPVGATWGDVVVAAAEHGLAAVHGTDASTGAMSFLLDGGISIYGRRFGVAANHVNSITIVTADGKIRRVTAATEPRLFWALRGGGGGFGIVTEIEIALKPIARIITASLSWDSTVAAAVAPIWLEWCRTAPRDISTFLRLVTFDSSPGVPRSMANRQLLVVDSLVVVEEAEDRVAALELIGSLFNQLRLAATPLLDNWSEGCPDTLIVRKSGAPAAFETVGDHFLVSEVTKEDLEELFDEIGAGSGSELREMELRQLGGDFADPERNGGSFDRTDAEFSFLAFGVVTDEASKIGHSSFLAAARSALSARNTGFSLPTLMEGGERAGRVFTDEALQLIEEVRQENDPDGLFFRAGQNVDGYAGDVIS